MENNVVNEETIVSDNIESVNDTIAPNNDYLPVKSDGFWNNFKGFWLQEVEQDNFWFQPITLTSPREKEIFGKIKDFLFQEIKFGK